MPRKARLRTGEHVFEPYPGDCPETCVKRSSENPEEIGGTIVGLLDMFKLEKLTIEAYGDAKRGKADFKTKFEAMYNPTSLKQSYAIKWSQDHRKGQVCPDGEVRVHEALSP